MHANESCNVTVLDHAVPGEWHPPADRARPRYLRKSRLRRSGDVFGSRVRRWRAGTVVPPRFGGMRARLLYPSDGGSRVQGQSQVWRLPTGLSGRGLARYMGVWEGLGPLMMAPCP